MEDRIREYVEELFSEAPYTQQVYELKVELIQNLTDKYHDLIEEGKTPEEAYRQTILGIGEVEELIASVEDPVSVKKEYKGNTFAVRIALAVMMYILCPVPLVIFQAVGIPVLYGVVILFVMIAVATGILIYTGITVSKERKNPNFVSDEYPHRANGRKRAVYQAFMSAYWMFCLALYFVLSFVTQRWDITWIIFLVAPALRGIIEALMNSKET